MSEMTHAAIPQSFFEYRAAYRDPVFPVPKLYSEVTEAVLSAFRPWNVTLENVAYRQNPANLGEVSVTFSLLAGRITFTVGLGSMSVIVSNPTWSESDLITNVLRAGLSGIVGAASLAVGEQRATLAMHVKPAEGSIKELVTALAKPTQGALMGGDVRGYGFSVYRQQSSWVVDTSALHRDALFVRIEHVVGPEVSLEEIAARLRADEIALLNLMNLQVD